MRSEQEQAQRDQGVPAEVPGIKIKNNYKAVPGPAIKSEERKGPMYRRRMTRVAPATAGLSAVYIPVARIRGVNNHDVSDDASTIDLTENDPLLFGGEYSANQKNGY